jgi:hypothetical protein
MQSPWGFGFRHYAGLFVLEGGGYGNLVCSIVHVRYCAAVLSLAQLFFYTGWLNCSVGERFTTYDGYEILIAKNEYATPYPRSLILASDFFYAAPVCEDWNWRDVLPGASHILLKQFSRMNFSEYDLVIVLRGGQHMWEPMKACLNYMQAPCHYFLDIMQNFSTTFVIGGDGSPCRKIIVQAGARSIPWDPVEGTRYMLYARNVAFARTSRAHAVIALSPIRQRFWLFDLESEKAREGYWWRGFRPHEFGEGYNCVASAEYRRQGLPWIPTPEQKQLLLNGTCRFEAITADY